MRAIYEEFGVQYKTVGRHEASHTTILALRCVHIDEESSLYDLLAGHVEYSAFLSAPRLAKDDLR